MSTKLRVVLNMSNLSIPEKISKGRLVASAVLADPVIFPSPDAVLADLTVAVSRLEEAYTAAADGGKSKTAYMHDKEADLMELMRRMAAYVETVANDDPQVVHLAGLEVRVNGSKHIPDFMVTQVPGTGEVQLRVKARTKALYKWQYSPEPLSSGSWVNALTTHTSKVSIGGLAPGFYWFRVIYVEASGDYTGSARRLGLNE